MAFILQTSPLCSRTIGMALCCRTCVSLAGSDTLLLFVRHPVQA